MNISSNFSKMSFNGLYENNNVVCKKTGVPHYNKSVYKLYNSTYHPYENESEEEINQELQKTNWGRSFVLYEDLQNEGVYYFMNKISVGEKISKSEEDKYIDKGFTKQPLGIDLNDDSFYATFNNNQYCTSDVFRLTPDRISAIEKEISGYEDFK